MTGTDTAQVLKPSNHQVSMIERAVLTPPPRMRKFPVQTRSQIMVESIKQAALKVACSLDNPQSLQIVEITKACGISTGSLYQYFECMDSIVSAIYEDVILDELERTGKTTVGPSDVRRILQYLCRLDSVFARQRLSDFYTALIKPGQYVSEVALCFRRVLGTFRGHLHTAKPYWGQYLATAAIE